MAKIKLTLPGLEIPVNGKQVSFTAPCDCSVVDGIQIDGVDYDVVDSAGHTVSFGKNVWCSGALLTVTLDVDNRKAYLQNQNGFTKAETLTPATASLFGLGAEAVPDDVFGKIGAFRKLGEYTTPGTYTLTIPDDISEVVALVISGGGGGAAFAIKDLYKLEKSYQYCATGGASGNVDCAFKRTVAGEKIQIVVGNGGAPATAIAETSYIGNNGNDGGYSSFGSVSVDGGEGGVASGVVDATAGDSITTPRKGFQQSTAFKESYGSINRNPEKIPYGGTTFNNAMQSVILGAMIGMLKKNPWFCCFAAGGRAMAYSIGQEFNLENSFIDKAVSLPNGQTTSTPALSTTGVATAAKGTDIACGGSAAVGVGSATGSAGCDGAVFVMGIR